MLASPLLVDVNAHKITDVDQQEQTIVETSFAWPDLEHEKQRMLLKPILENYQLSVTHLLNFLDLERGGPQYFIQRNLLRLPDAKTARLAFGTAIHAALRKAQILFNANQPLVTESIDEFKHELQLQHLEKTEFDRYLQKGEQLLSDLLEANKIGLKPGGMPERNVKNVLVGEARISGQLDRIDQSQTELIVTDYKTGSALGADLNSTAKTYAMKAFKHRTQLTFYSLLLAPHKKVHQQIKGEMIYLEADSLKNFRRSFSPTKQDSERLSDLIQVVWKKIMLCDWPDISKYSTDYTGTTEFIDDLINGKI